MDRTIAWYLAVRPPVYPNAFWNPIAISGFAFRCLTRKRDRSISPIVLPSSYSKHCANKDSKERLGKHNKSQSRRISLRQFAALPFRRALQWFDGSRLVQMNAGVELLGQAP